MAFQACIDPQCENEEFLKAKSDPDRARNFLNNAPKNAHTMELGALKADMGEVKVYEATMEGEDPALITFRQDGDVWYISNAGEA